MHKYLSIIYVVSMRFAVGSAFHIMNSVPACGMASLRGEVVILDETNHKNAVSKS